MSTTTAAASLTEDQRKATLRALSEARENIRHFQRKSAEAVRDDRRFHYRGLVIVWQSTAAAGEKLLRDAGHAVPLFRP